ncbi:MAG TPA: NF038122 family metalloprotease [Verrucomicrobiae bacterium]|nr:NF038122 family metalloprotease [Verrucomicrobiae bacterium]
MRYLKLFLLVLLALACNSTRALTIIPTFDSTVTNQPNAQQIEAAYSNAIQTLETLYTNSASVNITVYWGSPSLGQSQTSLVGNPTYSQLVGEIKGAAKTPYASNAVASLPVSDPVTGSHVFWIPNGEAKALGFIPNDNNEDGAVYFESDVTWTFSQTNRAVSGAYDFIAVAQHETSEVLGRSSDLGSNPSGGFIPFDLFHFSANGVRTFVPNLSGAYFSINNGATVLKYFSTSYDPQDWLNGSGPSDAYNASLAQGQEGPLSFADLVALDILGYQLHFTAPRVSQTRLANGNFQLTFNSVTGLNFQVQASTNLPSGAWTTLGAPVESPAGHYIFTDTQTSSHPTRFYRVVLE